MFVGAIYFSAIDIASADASVGCSFAVRCIELCPAARFHFVSHMFLCVCMCVFFMNNKCIRSIAKERIKCGEKRIQCHNLDILHRTENERHTERERSSNSHRDTGTPVSIHCK